MNKIHVSSFFDEAELAELVKARLIDKKEHPSAPLHVYNYSPLAQFDRVSMLNPIIQACRGLILDHEGFVVSRPFGKFYNVGEHPPVGETSATLLDPLPVDEEFTVYAKMDGSLGVAYQAEGVTQIATRGSFSSPQAIWASKHYADNYAEVSIPHGQTYLFEIISPVSKIVVNYKFADLVLLAIIDNETGLDLPLPGVWPGRVVERFNFSDFASVSAMANTDPPGSRNSEGFVIRFEPSGVRAKVKFADYLNLHRLATGLSSTVVHQHIGAARMKGKYPDSFIAKAVVMDISEIGNLLEGDPRARILKDTPDEMYPWLREQIDMLDTAADKMLKEHEDYIAMRGFSEMPREEAAALIKKNSDGFNTRVLFGLLSGQNPENLIWRLIKPLYSPGVITIED